MNNNIKLIKKIGSGSTGQVYVVHDNITQKDCAAKVVPMCEFNVKEINIWRQISSHENIVSFIDYFQHGKDMMILMENIIGGDLYELSFNFSKKISLYYFKQLILALQHIHQKDICHLDIKPENIMIDLDNNRLKLIDFDSCEVGTMVKSSKGTFFFLPPERLINECLAFDGKKADIWACGVVLFEMLTEKHPFNNEDEDLHYCEIATKIMKCDYLSNSLDDPDFDDLISRIFKKNPSERISLEDILNHKLLSNV